MKKSLLKIICALLFSVYMASPASAEWMGLTSGSGKILTCQISTPATASSAVVSGSAAFYGLIIITDGINDVTVNIYDNTAASGTNLIPTSLVIPGEVMVWMMNYYPAIKCTTGIYVSISVANGGTASYQVFYDR